MDSKSKKAVSRKETTPLKDAELNGQPEKLSTTSQQNKAAISTRRTKAEQVLKHLISAGMEGTSKLSAIKAFYDTCWNTSISTLGNKHNINIARERFTHIRNDGYKASLCRYWLADQGEARKALTLYNHLRRQRGAEPLSQVDYARLIARYPKAA